MKKLLLSLLLVLIMLTMAVPCKAVLKCTDAEHDWEILVGHGFEDSVFTPSLILDATELRSEKHMHDSIQVVVTTEREGHFKCSHQFVELEPTPSISSSETWKFTCKKCGAPRFFFTFQGTGRTTTQRKRVVLPGAGNINKGRIVIEVAHQGLILGTLGGAGFIVTNGVIKYGKFGDSYKDPEVDDSGPKVKADVPKERVPSEEPKETSNSSVFNITSTPSPADLHVDDNFVGNTPATVELPFGQHKIVVKKKGYKDWEKDLNISMKGKFSLHAELEKISKEEVKAETKSGDKIVFISKRDGGEDVYIMNADGSDVKRLTSGSSKKSMPSLSPDGKKIVFIAREDKYSVIYVMDSDGSNVRELTRNIFQYAPRWSPDGKKIVFYLIAIGESRHNISVMDADGSNVKRLTNDLGSEYSRPTWSPDGKKIAFSSDREEYRYEIYVMDADGNNVKKLTNNLKSTLGIPMSWSPDGKKIAFSCCGIYVIDADGSNMKLLTNNPQNKDMPDILPSWSPDGKKIAFVSYRDGNDEIYVMNADGTNVKRLTNNSFEDNYPSWRP